jgi:hypothetical protein
MPRRRSLTSLLFRVARTEDDLATLASGNSKRIERRAKTRSSVESSVGLGSGVASGVSLTYTHCASALDR